MSEEEIKSKLSDKELQKCLDELQGTNFLNAFCILDWIIKTREENEKLKNDIRALRGEIKVHSDKSNERYKAIKNQEKYIAKLHLEAQRYFDRWIETSQRINEAIEIIESYNLGKYDYSIPPGGIIDLLETLKGDNNG